MLVQDLTFSDIYKYSSTQIEMALKNLNQSEFYGEEFSGSIAIEIASRAEGVFLWVKLVIESLIKGIERGDGVAQLHRQLDLLPTDLEPLYFNLLSAVKGSEAAKVFSTVKTCEWSVLSDWSGVTLQPILTGKGLFYALTADTATALNSEVVPTTRVEAERISKWLSNVLEYKTANLVSIVSPQTSVASRDPPEYVVSYSHNTVSDFLHTQEAVAWLDKNLGDFDPHLALLRSLVLQLKTLDIGVAFNAGLDEMQELKCWSLVEAAMRYANEAYLKESTPWLQGATDEVTALLDSLDSTMTYQLYRWSSGSIQGHWSQFLPLGRSKFHNWEDSFLSFAASWNFKQYMLAYCENGNSLKKQGRPLLSYALSPIPGSTSFAIHFQVAQFLLERGADPNEIFGGETVWRRFLQTYYIFEAHNSDSDNASTLQKIYQTFLRHGADRRVAYEMAFAQERVSLVHLFRHSSQSERRHEACYWNWIPSRATMQPQDIILPLASGCRRAHQTTNTKCASGLAQIQIHNRKAKRSRKNMANRVQHSSDVSLQSDNSVAPGPRRHSSRNRSLTRRTTNKSTKAKGHGSGRKLGVREYRRPANISAR